MLPENVANIIVPAHIITGTDHTSGFFGHGKKSLMKRLLADVEACELLQHVGGRLKLQDDVRNDMRVFILTKIYGGDVGVSCDQAIASKWRKQKD